MPLGCWPCLSGPGGTQGRGQTTCLLRSHGLQGHFHLCPQQLATYPSLLSNSKFLWEKKETHMIQEIPGNRSAPQGPRRPARQPAPERAKPPSDAVCSPKASATSPTAGAGRRGNWAGPAGASFLPICVGSKMSWLSPLALTKLRKFSRASWLFLGSLPVGGTRRHEAEGQAREASPPQPGCEPAHPRGGCTEAPGPGGEPGHCGHRVGAPEAAPGGTRLEESGCDPTLPQRRPFPGRPHALGGLGPQGGGGAVPPPPRVAARPIPDTGVPVPTAALCSRGDSTAGTRAVHPGPTAQEWE